MRFTVKSGRHAKSLEAIDSNHAAQRFLEMLFAENDSPKLGGLISINCEEIESFVSTSEALEELSVEKKLQLYKGNQSESGPH